MTTTTTYPTHEQSWEIMRAIDPVIYPYLRRWASNDLSDELREWLGPDHGQGISSSDTNHHLASKIRMFEVPMVGPVVKAYESCGITVPEWALRRVYSD
jgi:hypothetical protein